jgi:hypothetical protein
MANQLESFDLSAIIARKTRLVTEVMQSDPTIAANWTPEALMSVSAHVAARYSARQDLMQDRARAQGIIMCLLNYALEALAAHLKATRNDPRSETELAVALAKKKDIQWLIAYAEKRQGELHACLSDLHAKNLIRVSYPEMPTHFYGITDPVTETQLQHFSEHLLLDQYDLPLATLEEERSLQNMCERVENEIKIAKLFDWVKILDEFAIASRFANRYFMRRDRETPNPAGGVLSPMLMGMVVRAFSGSWDTSRAGGIQITGVQEAEMLSLPTVGDLEGFLERVVEQRIPSTQNIRTQKRAGELSSLDIKYRERNLPPVTEVDIAAKIGQAAYQSRGRATTGSIFRKKLTKKEALSLSQMAVVAFNRAVADAKRFYQYAQGQPMPSGVEIQEFWCDRVLMNVQGNARVVLGETWAKRNEPWKQNLGAVITLEELLHLAEGFTVWPDVAKAQFAQTIPINRILKNNHDANLRMHTMLEVWGFMTRDPANLKYVIALMDRVEWDRFRGWFEVMFSDLSYFKQFPSVLLHIARSITWSNRLLLKMLASPSADELIPIALPKIQDEITPESWRSLINRAREYQRSTTLWETMRPEDLAHYFTHFDPSLIRSATMHRSNPASVVRTFKPLLEELRGNDRARENFRRWATHRVGHRGLNLPPQYQHILELLWLETFEEEEVEPIKLGYNF